MAGTNIYKWSAQAVECLGGKCIFRQEFHFRGEDGQSCNASFVCTNLEGYPCGNYRISVDLPPIGSPNTDICFEGQSAQGVLQSGESARIGLEYVVGAKFNFDCYFWCSTNQKTNDHCDCGEVEEVEDEKDHLGSPWHVQILKYSADGGGGFEFHCSGALIDDSYVLTAAHCFGTCPEDQGSLQDYKIVLGKSILKDPEDNVLITNAAGLSIHPNFNFTGTHPRYDMALVRLQAGLRGQHSGRARPVCLPLDFAEDSRYYLSDN